MSGWRAPALCDAACDWLASRYPSSLIVRELSVGKWGGAMIDIAAITETDIIGIEIKGDGDSHARLELQGHMYSRVATHMFLLTAPLLDKIVEKHMPHGWWHLRIEGDAIDAGRLGEPLFTDGRGRPHGLYWPPRLPNAPAQMLECLITRELRRVGKALVPAIDIGRTVPTMIAGISENAPIAKIRAAVCGALRERDWLAYDRSVGKERGGRYRWADGTALKGAL